MQKRLVNVLLSACMGTIAFGFSPAFAEKTLSADEVKALFSNKTFDGYQEIKNRDFKAYTSADGVFLSNFSDGKSRKGTWSVDSEGRHCVKLKSERCAMVISVGGDVYHKETKGGKHTHTLRNFVDGNQLPEPKPKSKSK